MDRFTLTALSLSAILLSLLIFSLMGNNPSGFTPRIWQLNDLLQNDSSLMNYPYHFRIVLFLNGVASVTHPTASQLPIEPFLQTIEPQLNDKNIADSKYIKEQERFKKHEARVIELLTAQSDVTSVMWTLDRAWYSHHGIKLPPAINY